jgi:FAD/FMN-containing dehydrogenase
MELSNLKDRLRGELVTAFDEGHAAAHDALIWNGRKPNRQARMIVRAACVEDVQEAVRFAAAHGMTVSPRGGGHHFTGIAARADMIIDLAKLDGLKIDVGSRTARIEPGVTDLRLAAALGRHDLAFPVGHCGSVPVSGYLIGGGIATAYHVRLHEAPKAMLTSVRFYPLGMAETVGQWAETAMSCAPASVEFTTKISAPPPGMPAKGMILAAIATVFASSDIEARSILAKLGENAPEGSLQVLDAIPTPFEVLYDLTAQSMPEGLRYAADSVWSGATYPALLKQFAKAMEAAPSPTSLALIMLRSPNAVLPGDAAFSRIGRIFGSIYGAWGERSEDDKQARWLRASMDEIAPLGIGTYAGETDLDRGPRRLKTHSAAAAARIDELAERYDPAVLFRGPKQQAEAP